LIPTSNQKVLGFAKYHGKKKVIVLFNTNFYAQETYTMQRDFMGEYDDLIHNTIIQFSDNNEIKKGEVILALPK
jgi:hypothetical protein